LAWGGACRKVLRKIQRETESVMKFQGEGKAYFLKFELEKALADR